MDLTQKFKTISKRCVDSVSNDLGTIPYIAANGIITFPLPLYKPLFEGIYALTITFNGKQYEEQAKYKVVNTMPLQAVRILEIKNHKIFKVTIPQKQPKNETLTGTNWQKEFSLPVLYGLSMFD